MNTNRNTNCHQDLSVAVKSTVVDQAARHAALRSVPDRSKRSSAVLYQTFILSPVVFTNMRNTHTLPRWCHGVTTPVVFSLITFLFGLFVASPHNLQAQPIPNNGSEIFVTPGDQSGSFSIGTMEQDFLSLNQPTVPSVGDGGLGVLGRVNYQAGKTIGTEESLLNFSAMPYAFRENTMVFGDLSIYRLNNGRAGGYAGIGVRQYLPNIDRTLGFITTYGHDGTYAESFQNIVLGIESRGPAVDWLTNIYLPTGEKEQEIGLDFVSGSQEFVNSNVQFDQLRTLAFNLSGFDMVFGTPLPGEFAQRFDMRAYAGFYNFNHDLIDDIWGWQMKLEANAFRYLDMNLNVTHDDTFDTRVTFNAGWTFDPRRDYGDRRTTWDRMMLPPSRLQTIPKAELEVVEEDIIAINPQTGAPYVVIHVNSNTGVNAPGAGTVTTPFDTVDNAINGVNAVPIDNYDIVFVHSGSTFDTQPTIVVPEGKRFLGEGDRVGHLLTYNQFGEQLFPRANGTFTDGIFDPRPLYTNLAGPGVTFDTLANLGGVVQSNAVTEFSGFVLGNPDGANLTSGDSTTDVDPTTTVAPGQGPTGDGIVFQNLPTQTQVKFVDIHGAQGDGLVFDSLTGTYALESVVVNQSTNHEIRVENLNPTITFSTGTRQDEGTLVDSRIINRDNGSAVVPDGIGGAGDNHDLLVLNTTGGSVFLNDTIINDIGADGILISNAASNVSIPVFTRIENSRAQSIFVAPNSSGTITIGAERTDGNLTGVPLQIINPGNNAIQIGRQSDPFNAALVTPAEVRFIEAIQIDSLDRDNSGLFIADTSGSVIFFSDATLNINSTTGAGTASQIEIFQNSTGNITFNNSMNLVTSGGSGIRISNNTVNAAALNTEARVRFLGDGNTVFISNPNQNEQIVGSEGYALVVGNNSPAGFPSNSVTGSPYENEVTFTSQLLINTNTGGAIFADGNTGPINFLNSANIDADADEVSYVLLENNTGNIRFSNLTIDADGSNIDFGFANPNEPSAVELALFHAAVDLRNNTGDITISDIDIDATSPGATTTGLFSLNNARLSITSGTIDVNNATALEVLTADSIVAAGGNLTDINLFFDQEINSDNAIDHGIHLANLKGTATFTTGNLEDAGRNIFTNDHAGLYIDNSAIRLREQINGFEFFSTDSLTVNVNDITFEDNSKGIRGISFDTLTVTDSLFDENDGEAIDLENVVDATILSSGFTDNHDAALFNELATIRTVYNISLNDEDQTGSNPQLYDFQVGLSAPDFEDFNDDNIPNEFDESFAAFSILMINNADDNTIGELNTGVTGNETGFIVNNNQFDKDASSLTQFQSFVAFIDNANSRLNMNVAMNDMVADDDNVATSNPVLGAISVDHNSDNNNADDNLVFTAIDNRIELTEDGSVAYNFVTRGDGFATILVDDSPDDILTEDGDPLLDLPDFDATAFDNLFVPDIIVAGTAFRFELETDAQVDILNTEIAIVEDDNFPGLDGSIIATQRGFEFLAIGSDNTDINIAGNTLLFEDLNGDIPGDQAFPNIDPVTLNINQILNDLLVVEFDTVNGTANIESTTNNNVLLFDGATNALITNPAFLFDANSLNNINGQFQFNNIFVP